jgi:hypothetical protein
VPFTGKSWKNKNFIGQTRAVMDMDCSPLSGDGASTIQALQEKISSKVKAHRVAGRLEYD